MYTRIIITIITLLMTYSARAAKITDIDPIKKKGLSSEQPVSVWLGTGLGLYFSSDNMHSYLRRRVAGDAWSTFLGMSGKICIDMKPFSWFDLQAEGEAFTSVNISGSLYRKHAYHRLNAALLPGFCFSYFDAQYIIAAGPAYSFHFFKGYQGEVLSYRIKISMIPYVNDLSPFPTTRGFIVFDYSYEDDNNFELGGWGIQLGGEIHIL